MKKLLTAVIFTVIGVSARGMAYSVGDFYSDLKADTKEVFLKDIQGTYFYDILEEEGNTRSKVGTSSTLVAWKFLSFAPGFIYTPVTADQKIEPMFSFPIRLGRIPLSHGIELRDLPNPISSDKWLSRFTFGPYVSKNFNDKHIGFGLNANYKFW